MSDKLSLAEFESFLDETCDTLRGNRDAAEFKEYVIAILFLKRLNDRFNLEREVRRNKLIAKGLSPSQIEEDLERREVYRLFVPEIARWEKLKLKKEDLNSYLMKVFAETDEKNRGCLGALNDIDFNKTSANGENFITNSDLVELIKKFDKMKLTDEDLDF
ncbi:type I restriction-modification system subunit M N-terminal domain-containing protein [Desulfosporosinus sp. BG]|uniref:type I restriction-modification system subunit M N-terminal domain-containing protein n=1 Tax=Desulfosporosinus sp. BG TaxID=1633135 RepID=UPI00083A7385|nr:type I restriction-modification system subunit M N-terminal domain-containing protein [Desulfosporosinus sp. BG]ODA42309.1 Type I restriction-modification system, DNA-methyltransferase subunit M [Desulfosporosinus sp. BG]